ncbi:immunity 53 family protein [Dactylosporangium sp. NPDC000521]|uniref:immunity 53 family protein n=1 Tax=Dactylosporangium sp. NPDC000521 TaxID=3363975 RepID=UPI0036A549CD
MTILNGQDPMPYVDGPDALTWLQGWYVTQCDGDWEHEYGVSIETLDNPGWSLRVDLQATAMDGLAFPKQEVHRSEHDWFIARLTGNRFEAFCGPLNLSEAIHQFRLWVTAANRGTS